MIEPTCIERPSFPELPSVDEIVQLAESTEWLLFQVPVVVTVGEGGKRSDETLGERERYIRELTPLLPTHRVWDGGFIPDEGWLSAARRNEVGTQIAGMARLCIRRVVTDQALEDHLDLLTSVAFEYRMLANGLMRRLAWQLQTEVEEFAKDISWHRHEQSGELAEQDGVDGRWRYFFHGVDCAFGSFDTGIRIEARLGAGEDFGVFDPYFFVKFVDSTLAHRAEYLPISEILRDSWDNGRRALEFMESRGVLRQVSPEVVCGGGWVVAAEPSL